MYVCKVCVCMYVMCVYMYVCNVCVYVCMYVMCVCIYVCNVCVCMYVCNVCMCVCLCVCVCMFPTIPSAKKGLFYEQYYPTGFVMEMHSVLGEVETDALSVI